MKKYIILSMIISSIAVSKDIEGRVNIGASASFGIEGLSSINIDKMGTIQMFKTKVDAPTTKNLQNFVDSIKKIDNKEKNNNNSNNNNNNNNSSNNNSNTTTTSQKPNKKVEPKQLLKKLILRGIQLDSTLFDGYITMNKIGTTLGAKVYGKTSRIGEDINIYKVGKAKVFLNIDNNKFKSNNTLYITGYDKKNIGLDKYRVEDSAEDKSNMQFDSDGVISPFETKVKPELAYRVSLGKRKEFLLAPGISTNLIDNDKHRLNLTANYYISNYKADKFDLDEVKYDLQDLAPGKQEVEYFKNWELGSSRDIKNGILDGKNGSIRSVGHPTGALYGENVVSYAMNKAYDYLIHHSGEAGERLGDIVDRIRNNKGKGKASLEDIIYLADKKRQNELIRLKDKFPDMYYTNLNDALFELGVTPRNREVSSYHLTQYIPTNSLDYILPQQQSTKEVKVQDRSAITESESENSNKFGELEYLFPQQNLKGVIDIISRNKFINSINEVTQVQKEMDKELEKIINYYNKNGIASFLWNIQPRWHKKGHDGKIYNDAKKMLDTINNKENNEKIKNTLEETKKFIQDLEKDQYKPEEKEKIMKSIKELKERIEEIESGLDLIPNDLTVGAIISKLSIWNIPTLIKMIQIFKDPKTTLLNPLDKIVGIKGTKMVKDATDIIFEPEKIPNFDMLLGLNIVKSEHDAVKYDYEAKMLKKLNKPEYAVHNGGVGQGLNINLRYDNKVKPIYLNTNVDMLHYSNVNNHMNRVVLSNELGYTPNKFDFVAKTDLTYKDIKLNDLSYSKLNADLDLSLKFKLRSRNSKWLLRPGVEYVGNYEYVNTKNSVVSVEIFERDKNGNLIDNDGNSVDISKESRYKSKYGKNLKEVFKHQSVTYSKKWLKPTHTIIPSVDIIYMPTKNIDISYGVIVPVKFIGKDFDGIMIKNKVGLGIKF
ncbi:hypothetical protein [uncultured Sneathia sp.]|uniref:hypothetical protein n=1 Tax=uncultured Sneathia sp. TaxID=278067 RepID=UPI00259BF118|nr:hypothetical protein [uncultured Sneathia sp.]